MEEPRGGTGGRRGELFLGGFHRGILSRESRMLGFSSFAPALAVDFLLMSDTQDQHEQAVIFNLRDEAIVTHAVFPELSSREPCSTSPMLRGSSNLTTRS